MNKITRRDFLRGSAAGMMSAALATVIGGSISLSAMAEEMDYENKELWTIEVENLATWEGSESTTLAEYLDFGSDVFDMDAYIESELGKNLIQYWTLYVYYSDPMDEAVVEWWEERKIRKELHDSETSEQTWAAYVPEEVEDGELLPVVFLFHGHSNSVWVAETYGFAQYGAEARYITIIPEASDGDEAVTEFDRIMTYLVENDYPVDESRVYACGFSKGGYVVENLAAAYPTRIAALTAGGNAVYTTEGHDITYTDEQMETLQEFKMPLMNYGGTFDTNCWPINEDSNLDTAEVKLAGLNVWLNTTGAVSDELTMEESQRLSEESEDMTVKLTGIDFTNTEVRELDGTHYYVGSFQNADGITVYEGVCIEGQMHWPAPSSAALCWEFLSQFARDTETGELLYLTD